MEAAGDLDVLDVAEAPRRFLQPVDRRVDGVHSRIGDAVLQIDQHGEEVALDPLCHLGPRPQPVMDGATEPAGKEVVDAPREV